MKLPPLAVTLAPGAALFGDIDSVAGTPRAVPGRRTSEPSKNVKNSTNTEYLRVNLTISPREKADRGRKIPARSAPRRDHDGSSGGPRRDRGYGLQGRLTGSTTARPTTATR